MKIDERDSREIRKLILDVLEDVKRITKIDFKIELESNTKFGEDIVLRLPEQTSGISKMDPADGKDTNYVRSGAKIIFNQIYSNGTEVSYRMSHIEGLTESPKIELKDKVPREKINRKYIMEKVLAFLEEAVKYEK